VPWFEKQDDIFAVSDPNAAEAYAHAPAQRLGVMSIRARAASSV